MRILVATDAWTPQVNGVVRTLQSVAQAARGLGAEISFLTPDRFPTVPLPTYPDIRLALPSPARVARLVAEAAPDAFHIATEGPVGFMMRRYCVNRQLPFTTSFHTRFPEYIAARFPFPEAVVWSGLRWFHGAASAVMAATPALGRELGRRGFHRVKLWPRGVDTALFNVQPANALQLPRPIFLSVGRLAPEKNVDAFLSLDLPGSKVLVGDGPQRAELQQRFPNAVFLGAKQGAELARIYASADVFVFPSRTDTFGLVLLEALACGVPVAAFPVSGPRDVLAGASAAGALNEDLRAACLTALTLSREDCRAFAEGMTWEASARCFLSNIRPAGDRASRRLAALRKRRGRAAGRIRRVSVNSP